MNLEIKSGDVFVKKGQTVDRLRGDGYAIIILQVSKENEVTYMDTSNNSLEHAFSCCKIGEKELENFSVNYKKADIEEARAIFTFLVEQKLSFEEKAGYLERYVQACSQSLPRCTNPFLETPKDNGPFGPCAEKFKKGGPYEHLEPEKRY